MFIWVLFSEGEDGVAGCGETDEAEGGLKDACVLETLEATQC